MPVGIPHQLKARLRRGWIRPAEMARYLGVSLDPTVYRYLSATKQPPGEVLTETESGKPRLHGAEQVAGCWVIRKGSLRRFAKAHGLGPFA